MASKKDGDEAKERKRRWEARRDEGFLEYRPDSPTEIKESQRESVPVRKVKAELTIGSFSRY